MSDQEDQSQKTEEPSQRKLEKAKEKGDIFTSKEVNSFFLLFILALCVGLFSGMVCEYTKNTLAPYISFPYDILAVASKNTANIPSVNIRAIIWNLTTKVGFLILAPAIVMAIVSIASLLVQHGVIYAPEVIQPKFSRISIISGFKRIFSLNSVMELIKGILKISLVGVVIYIAVKSDLQNFSYAYALTINGGLHVLLHALKKLFIGVCCIMFILAIIDYIYQRHTYMKKMRMTKTEVKDEHKQQEGSPEIKSKLRSMMSQISRRRIMAAVPKADVVITNPTHYAVALQYDIDTMENPIVVAKGQDNLAIMIRKIAEEHKIPIVENPPLARMLYADLEVDMAIQFKHYKAVAEVISYIMKLRGKKLPTKKTL